MLQLYTYAHRLTQADKLGQIGADKSRQILTVFNLCNNFIRGEIEPETGWGVPKKKETREREPRQKRSREKRQQLPPKLINKVSLYSEMLMSVRSADGPTSSDRKVQPKLVWESHELISFHCSFVR